MGAYQDHLDTTTQDAEEALLVKTMGQLLTQYQRFPDQIVQIQIVATMGMGCIPLI